MRQHRKRTPTAWPAWASTCRKALGATLGATLAAVGAAMLDGELTTAEGIAAAGLGLVTGFATWRVPNAPTGGR